MKPTEAPNPGGKIDARRALRLGAILAVAFEVAACVFRFGLGMESTRDTAALAAFTFGLRIHHGYLGAVGAAFLPLVRSAAWRERGLAVAVGLIASDLAHHFLVLWPITGSPEFDLFYE